MDNIPIMHVEINDIRTAHTILGDGQPLLMLHGWGANIALVFPLAERLSRLGYQVYIPDLPGFGESAPPAAAWSIHDYARFLLAYTAHHRLERFYLFGHSFGGRLGLVLGSEYGSCLIKMVLANSAGIRSKVPLAKQARLNAYKFVRDTLKLVGLNGVSDSLRDWYTLRYGSADFQAVSGVMRQTFVKVVNEDLRDYAARVQPSTLLLWGDRDEDTPLWQGRLLEQLIPDAGLVVYEGAGHYSYLDRLPDAVRVIDFFFKQP